MLSSNLQIVVCSRSRPQNLITKKLFEGFPLLVVVPESQVQDYKHHNPDPNLEIIAHPNWVRGIGDARYWVMTNFGDCFMIDDDADHIRNYAVVGKSYDVIRNPEHVNDIIQNLYFTAKEAGAKMFGFGNIKSQLDFRPQRPFSFSGGIHGSMCGFMADHGLSYDFDEKLLNTCEDFYFSALNAYKNRFCFIDNRYTIFTDEKSNSIGGRSDYMTAKDIDKATEVLMKFFGKAIRTKEVKNKKQRILTIPY